MPRYIVFLLFGITLIGLGVGTYYIANLSTTYNIPKGAMWIGIGPRDNMTPIGTRMIFYVPQDAISLEVSFSFTEFEKYRIYIVMPFETVQADPYVIHQSYPYSGDEIPKIGNVSVNFQNFPKKGSSVINMTFVPNTDFHFLPNEVVTLSMHARVSELVSINYPLGSKQTVIFTFFGSTAGVMDEAMAPYIGINNIPMADYPFQVVVQFPKESYLSSDTFPNPIELFVTESFRSTMFDLDFSYPEGYAHSVSCSYINPEKESQRSFWTFVSGVFLTTGISSLFVTLRRKTELTIEKPNNGEKMRDTEKGTEKKKDDKENEILELIRLVDRNFKFTPFDFFLRGGNVYPSVAFIVFFALIGVFLVFTRSLYEQIVVATSFSAFGIAFFSLLARFGEEHIVEVNFKRFGMCVEGNRKPLLKALIKMKVKNSEFDLEQIYNLNKSMFEKEKLLDRLYE